MYENELKGKKMDTPEVVAPAIPETEVDWKAEFEKAEKRRKDTQAEYTKGQQTLKAMKAELQVLQGSVTTTFTAEETKVLEELKYKDPDAWHAKLTELTTSKRTALQTKIEEHKSTAVVQDELERRTQVLAEFNLANPGLVLNDEVIQFDIPKRITSKLEKGEVSFEDFLAEAKEYLTAPKKVKVEGVEQQPNLNKVGGGTTPTVNSAKIQSLYEKEIF